MHVHSLPQTQQVCLGKILNFFCLHKKFTLGKTEQNVIFSPQTRKMFCFALVWFGFVSNQVYTERKHSTLEQCEEFLFY